MRTPCEGKTDYVPGRIQALQGRLATQTRPYGLPRCVVRETPKAAAQTGHGKVLYGLPCARCRAYYPADLAVCPVCNSTERVFPKLNPFGRRPAFVPGSKAVDVPQEEKPGNLATINQELLSNCA